MSPDPRRHILLAALTLLALTLLALPGLAPAAHAQARGAAPAWASGGYNNAGAALTQAYASPLSGSNGDLVVINGEIQSPGMTSVVNQYSRLSGGSASSGAGAGYATAAAIGNSLNIQVQGSGDTVIVSAVQTNNGAVSATVASPK